MFLLAGLLLSRYRSVDELDLYGRARQRWVAGWAFVLASLALAGMPPFGTGLGKGLIDDAGGSTALTVLTVAVSALTGGTALRVALRVYFGLGRRPDPELTAEEEVTGRDEEPDTRPPHDRTPISMVAAITVLLAGGLAVGVFPSFAAAAGDAAAASSISTATWHRRSVRWWHRGPRSRTGGRRPAWFPGSSLPRSRSEWRSPGCMDARPAG